MQVKRRLITKHELPYFDITKSDKTKITEKGFSKKPLKKTILVVYSGTDGFHFRINLTGNQCSFGIQRKFNESDSHFMAYRSIKDGTLCRPMTMAEKQRLLEHLCTNEITIEYSYPTREKIAKTKKRFLQVVKEEATKLGITVPATLGQSPRENAVILAS